MSRAESGADKDRLRARTRAEAQEIKSKSLSMYVWATLQAKPQILAGGCKAGSDLTNRPMASESCRASLLAHD